MCYQNNTYYLYFRVLTISGAIISVGSIYGGTFSIGKMSLVLLETNKVLLSYSEINILRSRIITINGSTVTINNAVQCNTSSSEISAVLVTADRVLICYQNSLSV